MNDKTKNPRQVSYENFLAEYYQEDDEPCRGCQELFRFGMKVVDELKAIRQEIIDLHESVDFWNQP